MNERFRIIDAKCGDVLYIRMNDEVRAIKIVKKCCGHFNPMGCRQGSYLYCLVAGKGDEPERFYVGFGCNRDFYRTIEDCINGQNSVMFHILTAKDLAEECGADVTVDPNSTFRFFGVWKFRWDKFMPKRVHVKLSSWDFANDGNGWKMFAHQYSYEKEPTKYYDTYEECLADNHVKVITF